VRGGIRIETNLGRIEPRAEMGIDAAWVDVEGRLFQQKR
jgi:hypothetical protein